MRDKGQARESAEIARLQLRGALGGTMIAHGVKHARSRAGTTGWFGSIGFRRPELQADLSAAIEIGSGVALMAGAATPLAASVVVGTMSVAIRTVHAPNSYFITAEGWEYTAFLGAAAVALAALGSGRTSVDRTAGLADVGTPATRALVAAGLGITGAAAQLRMFWRAPGGGRTVTSDRSVDDEGGRGMTTTIHRNVIIVGSGPAGYTAALYAARADLAPLVFEGSQYGGALMNTTEVENFPGFPEGILGPDLMNHMRAQGERFGAELVQDDVVSVDLTGWVKTVRTHDGEYSADVVILSMGSAYRKLGVTREDELSGHGVSWCATCDGFFFRDQDIAVVGGGDTAMEEATFLTRFARSVTIVHRRDSLRASRIMVDRAVSNPKIKFAWNSEVADIHGEKAVSGLRLRDTVNGDERDEAFGGLFIAIGHEPRSELLVGQVDLDNEGYVRTGAGTRTNIEGVFAAGDLVDHTYQQAITAAETGCQAALDAESYLAALADRRQPAAGAS